MPPRSIYLEPWPMEAQLGEWCPLFRAGCRTRLLLATSTGSSATSINMSRAPRRPLQIRVMRTNPRRNVSTRLQTDRPMSGHRRKKTCVPLTSPPLGDSELWYRAFHEAIEQRNRERRVAVGRTVDHALGDQLVSHGCHSRYPLVQPIGDVA